MVELTLSVLLIIAVVILAKMECIHFVTFYSKDYFVWSDGVKLYSRLFGKYGRYIRQDGVYNVFGHPTIIEKSYDLFIGDYVY